MRVILYGDSLLWEAKRYLTRCEVHAYPGTAPCDWTPQVAKDCNENRPDKIGLVFSGNSHTPCMSPVDWGDDGPLIDRYLQGIEGIKVWAHPTPVLWIRTPVKRDGRNGVQSIPCDIDAGYAVETRYGTYAKYLDCEQVRHPDGVHFSPLTGPWRMNETIDAPGARRFAAAIELGLGF